MHLFTSLQPHTSRNKMHVMLYDILLGPKVFITNTTHNKQCFHVVKQLIHAKYSTLKVWVHIFQDTTRVLLLMWLQKWFTYWEFKIWNWEYNFWDYFSFILAQVSFVLRMAQYGSVGISVSLQQEGPRVWGLDKPGAFLCRACIFFPVSAWVSSRLFSPTV